ncbi:hypothetical protein [Streptomyces alanosinicus]|uniref:hypothetical protein n=1 Tax=Streptomyces alanosinicus TaxID=68171 RepID=UPI001E646C4E|nr:hypothetical protein [Streptomyces alanosinicus]
MSVPVDPADPGGRKVAIAVSRLPAADRGRRIGVLAWNPGGPGIAGSYVPAAQLPPELRKAIERIVESGFLGVQLRVNDEHGEWVGSAGRASWSGATGR